MDSPFGLTVIVPGAAAQIVTHPTYTEIFNSTVGTLATDADGMPAEIGSIAELEAAFEIDAGAGDSDLNDTLTAGGQQDVSTANALAASLPGITATGDALIGGVDTLLTPISAPAPAPAPAPSGPYTPPANAKVTTLPAMIAGGAVVQVPIDAEQRQTGDPQCIKVTLKNGDASIFQVKGVTTNTSNINTGTMGINTNWILFVTPGKVGTFYAEVDDADNCSQGADNTLYFQVTIAAAATPSPAPGGLPTRVRTVR